MFFKKWKRNKKEAEAVAIEDVFSDAIVLDDAFDTALDADDTLPYLGYEQRTPLLNAPLAEAFNRFGFALAANYLQDKQDSCVLSPLSIETAFCLAYNGAAGQTAQQMAQVLGLEAFDLETLNEANASLKLALEKLDDSLQIQMANSLWLQNKWPFLPAYLKRMQAYDGALFNVDFAQADTADKINTWVAEQTRDCIPQLVDPPTSEDTLAMLINTLYFKGKWQNPFASEDTELQPFYGQNKQQELPMMQQSGSFAYYLEPTSQTQILRLFYAQTDFALLILLPPEGSTLQSWWQTFPFQNWKSLSLCLEERPGQLSLPRFQLESDLDLIPYLQNLGMHLPFEATAADFSQMSERVQGNSLFISQVKHKTRFQVNEEGSEAAAATLISMELGCAEPSEPPPPFEMHVNRPFVCCLQEVSSGLNLFVGLIQDLEAEA